MQNRIFVVILFISMILGFGILTRGHDWGDDFASYIMQAESISEGTIQTFMQRNSFTVEESFGYIGPTTYPWGYPLSLVPALWLRGIHPIVLKLPGLLFFAGFLLTLYLWMKTRFTPTESLLLVSLFSFNPVLIRFTDQIISDIPFLFFSTLTLFLIMDPDRFSIKRAIWIGLSIAFAFFIRRQGILLLGAYGLTMTWDAWNKRNDKTQVWKIFQHLLIVAATFIFVWIATALIFPSEGESYFVQYNAFQWENIPRFIGAYILVFGEFFGSHWAWKVIYWIMVAFFVVGAWTRNKEETVLLVFFIAWMLLLITWPFWQGVRFIFPLLPIFIYFAFTGMKYLTGRLPEINRQSGLTISYLFLAMISAVFLFTSSWNTYVNLRDDRDIAGPFDVYSDEMFKFIREETPEESVIVFFKPRAMSLFADRYAFMAVACDRLSLGDYVSLHKKWDNSQVPPNEVDECGVPLQVVFENRRFIVYQVLK